MGQSAKLNLREYVSSREKKQTYANRLFQTIAPRYDFITRFLSYGMDASWKRTMVTMMKLKGSETVLDIACGTGDITFKIAEKLSSGMVAGLDITPGMLEIGERRRVERSIENVAFHQADIMQIPFGDETFDYVTGGYALRNVPDLPGALREISRVLKPGGALLSLDFGHPPNRSYRWLYLKYLVVAGSLTGLVLHGDPDTYRYIPETLKLYPGQRGVQSLMENSGWRETGFREFMGGIMAINFGRRPW
ncbi:MAG TPA: ubiquinone/menaquinone biosynthesis methyltransferase [Blastocatellia bacterium]|nr:ubiquinone/menaquinone biosynthesis methyltransferase [Blastocatellia bacterium]